MFISVNLLHDINIMKNILLVSYRQLMRQWDIERTCIELQFLYGRKNTGPLKNGKFPENVY